MASSSDQQDSGHLKFKSNSPCFFKLILQDTIQSGKLGIPKKFVKKHGNEISSPALLRVPSGEVWKVELTKSDGKIWLENGWPQFSNHYTLDFGYLLVFRYDGNSNFHVVIFDTSATEIQYPHTGNNNERSDEIPVQNIDESQDNDSTPIRKPQLPCPQPHKMMRSTNVTIKTETECNEKSGFLPQQVEHNGCPVRNGDKSTGHKTLKVNERVRVLEGASNACKSENPFFMIVMQPCHVGCSSDKKFRLTIPINFAREHLMKKLCSVTLSHSSGKTWTVTLKQRQRGKKLDWVLQTGWRTFAQDNNIQVGDVCAFELINSIEISFRVVIYQGQQANYSQSLVSTDVVRLAKRKAPSCASPSCPEPLTDLHKAKALQIASVFKSENPFFVVVLHPSHVNSNRLSIPAHFARQYLSKMHKEVILLLSNGKSWPVICYQYSTDGPKLNVRFGNGWRKFSLDNNLEVGDACVFELVEGAEASMNITIYKKQADQDANFGSSMDDKSGEQQVEFHERLVIKTEEICLDDILMSKTNSPGKA